MENSGLLLGAAAVGAYLLYKHGVAAQAPTPAATAAPASAVTTTPAEPVTRQPRPMPPIKIYSNNGTTAYVTSLYRTLYQREPDAAGLAFWVNNLDKGGGTPESVYQAFINSDEYKALHPMTRLPAYPIRPTAGPEIEPTPTPTEDVLPRFSPRYPIDPLVINYSDYGGRYSY